MSMNQVPSCHSLVLRLPGPVDAVSIEQRLRISAAEAWPELAAIRLWEENLPYEANHPGTHTRIRQEAERQLNPAGLPLRAVLLRYPDGDADLVMVARREITFGSQDFTFDRDDTSDTCTAFSNHSGLEWGLGDPTQAGYVEELPIPFPDLLNVDAVLLHAAAQLVLSRYNTSGVAVDESQTAKEFLAYQRSSPDEKLQVYAGLGVLVQDAQAGRRYFPNLIPALPAMLHFTRQHDSTTEGTLRYDQAEVSSFVAERFATHLALAAQSLSADPDQPLQKIQLLSQDELDQVLRLGASPAPSDTQTTNRSIHGTFSDLARKQPEAIAVTVGKENLSYAELDRRSDKIAAGLRALSISPGDMVGVALERGIDLVPVLLGILKANCTYVPMDLRYPPERLRYTTEDAGAAVIISNANDFPEIPGVQVVTPCQLNLQNAEAVSGVPQDAPSPLAYVIYTSGSTGRPKGVVVPHRNVVNLIEATRKDFQIDSGDVWTLFHSSAFDFSVWEIWGCLLTGGRLVVVDYWTTRDTELFHDLLLRERVTVLNQTPSAFAQLIEVDRYSTARLSTRLVIFGGEPLDVRMLTPWFARYSHATCRMVNMFGITETTVHVTAHTVTPFDVVNNSRQVGRALPGWTLSIRDPYGRVLPLGAVGEICVGGVGVADRYLGQPSLTSERFIADPHGGGRIYLSGDRGRLRADGCLEHLGRLDSQVKVRGHRIELDEIRNTLLSHSEVTGAVAILNHDVPGDPATARIDAYVTLRASTSTDGVLEYARSTLPSYMVPASITRLKAIPLTINGKVDSAFLPTPEMTPPPDNPALAAPTASGRDHLATQILDLWGHALKAEVSEKDNFFEFGGNSLLVVRLLREMRAAGLPKVTAQDFYRNSTAGEFIELVRSAQS
ncbi:non-ribosomal peptide synthetase [Streptomyces halstedii]|uniref:non-ribosomal peptide synthetase n=1 Tax=Streptomyces halstedii TaxID=1944 RepID=UPI0037F4AC75